MNDIWVIAISDAPLVDSNHYGKKLQAYKRGDIFKVYSKFSDQIVIWNDTIQSTIACNIENFEILSEHRHKQINKIL